MAPNSRWCSLDRLPSHRASVSTKVCPDYNRCNGACGQERYGRFTRLSRLVISSDSAVSHSNVRLVGDIFLSDHNGRNPRDGPDAPRRATSRVSTTPSRPARLLRKYKTRDPYELILFEDGRYIELVATEDRFDRRSACQLGKLHMDGRKFGPFGSRLLQERISSGRPRQGYTV